MSKVILLSGSPNADGNTMQVLKTCASVIEKAGVETEVVSLSGMELKDAMNFRGGYNDGFDAIVEKVKDAQGLIVGGPVYWGTARAELMTALQRLAMASMQNGNFLSRMVGGPIAIARRGGVTSAIQEMMMFFLANDMIVPGSTYWNIVFGQAPGSALLDSEGMSTVARFAENVAFVIKKINA
jgi:multimeric flavodoxin WrbA